MTVTFDGSTNLLRSGGDSVLALHVQTVVLSLTSDRSSAGHVLVRRVGARTDESNLELGWPVVLLDSLLELLSELFGGIDVTGGGIDDNVGECCEYRLDRHVKKR